LQLTFEEVSARSDFSGLRVAIAGRPTLHDVRDVAVAPLHVELFDDQAIEQATRAANERFTCEILVAPGTLTDKHHARMRIANAEDDVCPARGELTGDTDARLCGELLETGHRKMLSPHVRSLIQAFHLACE